MTSLRPVASYGRGRSRPPCWRGVPRSQRRSMADPPARLRGAVRRGDGGPPPGAEGIERLTPLLLRVHHERPVPGDLLTDRPATEHQHLQRRGARLLTLVRADGQGVARTEHGELPAADRA